VILHGSTTQKTALNINYYGIVNMSPGGIRQTKIHTAEPFVPEPSATELEVAIRKMKRYKEPGSDQILAELIQAGGRNIAF
jgi:hypothetical protein